MLQAEAEGKLPTDQSTARLSLIVPLWLEERKRLKEANTARTESYLVKPLLAALGEKRLCDIGAADIRSYQQTRSQSVSPHTVNREIRILRAILKQHKLWSRIADDYERLKESTRGPGRALSDAEEKRLFETAASRPEWEVAYLAALAASNTTARACELRVLRLQDVDLAEGVVCFRKSKTDGGRRIVPLNPAARWAFARLVERAQTLGASEPGHCLFPSCQRLQIDVTTPQVTWRTAWRTITKKAGLPKLRFHDLRHHAITRLAESGAPEQTIMALAGHVSQEMLAHYSHVRQQSKRQAVEAINSYHPAEMPETAVIQ
jgi:integrase